MIAPSFNLRPYQEEAVRAINDKWTEWQRELLVLPTGCGKTVVFNTIANQRPGKTLILAHRDELIEQARDKYFKMFGDNPGKIKAMENDIRPVTVGSVQTMCRRDYSGKFDTVIVDEAHHAISPSYKAVLDQFPEAKVLGVTATPDRGDKKSLARYFDGIAYEYKLKTAVSEGYLVPIMAKTIPLEIDMTQVKVSLGDFEVGSIAETLEPYLPKIAESIRVHASARKTVVFCPLISIAQELAGMIPGAREVNGNSQDRKEVLEWFDQAGPGAVLCNAMLLTEGWDCPSVDCIVVLRPTKVRSLYCLDEKTEVLTHDGWKSNVEVGEDVLAFDARTGKTRFVPVLAKIRRKLEPDEYFCSIKGQSTDIRVTNHHRMLYDNKRRKGWKFKEAQDIAKLKDGVYLPVSGHGEFAGVPLTDAELTFIGWVMTDGSINPANNQITITQGENHEKYCEEIERCIIDCGFKFNRIVRRRTIEETHYNAHGNMVLWTISKGKPRGHDKHLTGWGRLEPWLSKDISPMLFDMTERQFAVMLEAIYHGDGNKFWKTTYHIGKGNKTFIERLQIMAIQRGYRASVSFEKHNEVRKSDLWYLHVKKQNFVKVGSISANHAQWREEEHTDETCWCVQTELGTIVTRRNGRVAIVGNCQMVGRGTRLHPGKDNLLILDFLWLTHKHNLCRPASLVSDSDEDIETVVKKSKDEEIDLFEAASDAEEARRTALAEQLRKQQRKKSQLINPLELFSVLDDIGLADYEPTFRWERDDATEKQVRALQSFGIDAEGITKGYACAIMDRLITRRSNNLASVKQVKCLRQHGYDPIDWTFDQAARKISALAAAGWKRWKLHD